MAEQNGTTQCQSPEEPLRIGGYEEERLVAILQAIRARPQCSIRDVDRIVRRHRTAGLPLLSRAELVAAYRELCARGRMPFERSLLRRLQRKPVRTQSGVAPVTVLTKPFPCPGACIFCPQRESMPKSYLADEPGAMRAVQHGFDPFEQTASRLVALRDIGHATDKVELLILGGSWSAYPADYQKWFVRRCLEALNGRESSSLPDAQQANETADHRNVGLVIETRPDLITPEEVRRLRWLGVTKVQLGLQSLDDEILRKNHRGHTVAQSRRAMRLLRLAGFKIAVHWMPQLLGATPESDLVDFRRLWDDPALRPDEMKIYPCVLLPGTELHALWQQGLYQPYSEEELVDLLVRCKLAIPRYCRVNRLMRDIPAPNIVAGVNKTNLRQVVHAAMRAQGATCQCIRCREIRGGVADPERLRLEAIAYDTDVSEEHFLSMVTPENRLAGFLRLSLPAVDPPIEEIRDCAMIREVHVYGPALELASSSEGEAQHLGLGSRLIVEASQIARHRGFGRLAVIAAVGTRQYYRQRGFQLGELYMTRAI